MESEKVVRRAPSQRRKQKPDDAVEIRPEVMDKESSRGDANALSAAEKVMKDLEKLLKKRCKQELKKKEEENPNPDESTKRHLEEHGSEVDGAKFLMNPRSFTQSVENIFNFSFLVKKGKAAIGVRSGRKNDGIRRPGLWVQHRSNDDVSHVESTQAVVSFTMEDWRRICQQHCFDEGDIPHRSGLKQAYVSQPQGN